MALHADLRVVNTDDDGADLAFRALAGVLENGAQ